MTIGIWKSNESINTKYCLHESELQGKCYGWTVNTQNLICGDGDNETYGKQECVAGDIIEMILDLTKSQLSYTYNGIDCGAAFVDIQSTSYRVVISTYAPGDEIELMSYSKLKDKSKQHENDVPIQIRYKSVSGDDMKCEVCSTMKDIAQQLKLDKDRWREKAMDLQTECESLTANEIALKEQLEIMDTKIVVLNQEVEILKNERQMLRRQSSNNDKRRKRC